MDPIQRIDQAFRQLEFAVKLYSLADQRKLDREALDVPVSIDIGGGNARFDEKIFRDHDDMVKAALNNVNVSIAAAATALDTVYDLANIPPDPRRLEAPEDLRSVVRMVRAAFSKDLIAPKWDVRGRFVRAFHLHLENVPEEIDLSARDQTPFTLADIGGVRGLVAMKNAVKKLV